jgi:hypothetical protein
MFGDPLEESSSLLTPHQGLVVLRRLKHDCMRLRYKGGPDRGPCLGDVLESLLAGDGLEQQLHWEKAGVEVGGVFRQRPR